MDSLLIEQIKNLGIQVVKVENDELHCLCPKHQDSSPSFFFNLKTEKFHCFVGCLKGRGIHQLIFQITGVSTNGKPSVEPVLKKFTLNRENDKKILPTIPLLPLAWNNPGEVYLINRGFAIETIKEYGIMFWEEEGAIVIPLDDVGYVIRYLSKDAPKKYKYIAGTRITDTLFGVKKLPETLTNIILVEGSLDCLWLRQIGFPNSLALLHADITPNQLRILRGVSNYVYLMLDGDNAGREASLKIKKILGGDFIVKVCNLPEGKDPDNLNKNEILEILKTSK